MARRNFRETAGVESGMVTVLVAAFMLVGMTFAVLMLQFGWSAHRASEVRNTADLAAISGAQVLRETGSADRACAAVRELATGMVASCDISGDNVTVEVTAEGQFGWIAKNVSASAMAGPAGQVVPLD